MQFPVCLHTILCRTVTMFFLRFEGIQHELIVGYRVGRRFVKSCLYALYLHVVHADHILQQSPDFQVNRQLIQLQHLAMLLVFHFHTKQTDILTEEVHMNLFNADLRLQLFLQQDNSLLQQMVLHHICIQRKNHRCEQQHNGEQCSTHPLQQTNQHFFHYSSMAAISLTASTYWAIPSATSLASCIACTTVA